MEGSSNHLPDLFLPDLICKYIYIYIFYFLYHLARYQVDARGSSNGLRTRPIWPARLQPEKAAWQLDLHAEQPLSFCQSLRGTRGRIPMRRCMWIAVLPWQMSTKWKRLIKNGNFQVFLLKRIGCNTGTYIFFCFFTLVLLLGMFFFLYLCLWWYIWLYMAQWRSG